MDNCSMNFLKSNGLVQGLEEEIKKFLSKTPEVFYTSHEISMGISGSKVYNDLVAQAHLYSSSFKEPATHIGSLCASLNNDGKLKRRDKHCPKLQRIKAAFAI